MSATRQIREKTVTVPLKTMDFNTGTWTYSTNSGIPKYSKAAAAETTVVTIPLNVPKEDIQYGFKLKSIKIPVRATTTDLTSAPTFTLYQTNKYKAVVGAGTNIDATSLTTSNDAVVTAAATDRLWTVTVSTQAFENLTGAVNDYAYTLTASIPCAAGTVLTVYEPTLVYETAEG